MNSMIIQMKLNELRSKEASGKDVSGQSEASRAGRESNLKVKTSPPEQPHKQNYLCNAVFPETFGVVWQEKLMSPAGDRHG